MTRGVFIGVVSGALGSNLTLLLIALVNGERARALVELTTSVLIAAILAVQLYRASRFE